MIAKIKGLYTHIFFRSRFFFIVTVLSLVFNALIWSLIILALDILREPGREFIFLHYKVPIGPDLYSNWYWIFVLPVMALLFIFVNFFFGRLLYPKQRVYTHVLAAIALLCQIIFLRAVYLIIQINLY